MMLSKAKCKNTVGTLYCLDYMTLTPGKIKVRNPVLRDTYLHNRKSRET